MNIVNLYENYNNYFNADLKAIFESCSKMALKFDYKIYLIGGIVRDLLLSKKIEQNFVDIDITIEGDAIQFCQLLEENNVGKVLSIHERFGTAKIEIQGKKIDFASTRSEIYKKAGHLPTITEIGCSLEKDVIRRDFTINSLALSLNKENFGDLIDYVGGFEDLQSKKIKVLHEKSFIDDPTRIIRGLKFSVRFGFELDKRTLELQDDYLKNINYDMGYKRVKSELKQTFNLNFQNAFEKFITENIYKLITVNNVETPKVNIENLVSKYNSHHPWLVYLGIVGVCEADDFSYKLELTNAETDIILDAKKLLASDDLNDDFQIYKAFGDCKVESLILFAIFKGEEKVSHYVNDLKKIKLLINGKDVLEMGFEPSKRLGAGLDFVLKQKLKYPKMKKEEEMKLIKEFLIVTIH